MVMDTEHKKAPWYQTWQAAIIALSAVIAAIAGIVQNGEAIFVFLKHQVGISEITDAEKTVNRRIEQAMFTQGVSHDNLLSYFGQPVWTSKIRWGGDTYTVDSAVYDTADITLYVEIRDKEIVRYVMFFKFHPKFLRDALGRVGLKAVGQSLRALKAQLSESGVLVSAMEEESGELIVPIGLSIFGGYNFGAIYYFPRNAGCYKLTDMLGAMVGNWRTYDNFSAIECEKTNVDGFIVGISRINDGYARVGSGRDLSNSSQRRNNLDLIGTAINVIGFWQRDSLKSLPRQQ